VASGAAAVRSIEGAVLVAPGRDFGVGAGQSWVQTIQCGWSPPCVWITAARGGTCGRGGAESASGRLIVHVHPPRKSRIDKRRSRGNDIDDHSLGKCRCTRHA
ncbi:MAG: hypothetical protein ACK5PF_04500, partial [bacterium]